MSGFQVDVQEYGLSVEEEIMWYGGHDRRHCGCCGCHCTLVTVMRRKLLTSEELKSVSLLRVSDKAVVTSGYQI